VAGRHPPSLHPDDCDVAPHLVAGRRRQVLRGVRCLHDGCRSAADRPPIWYHPRPARLHQCGEPVRILIGAVGLGSLSDQFGRKSMFIVEMVIFTAFLAAAVFCTSFISLVICLFGLGLALGCDYPTAHMIISENIPSTSRGKLVLGAFAFQARGALCGTAVGYAVLVVMPNLIARVWMGKDTPPAETGLWWCRAEHPSNLRLNLAVSGVHPDENETLDRQDCDGDHGERWLPAEGGGHDQSDRAEKFVDAEALPGFARQRTEGRAPSLTCQT